MKNISEYSASTTSYELFVHLYDKVINKEIFTFSDILDYTKNIPLTSRNKYIYIKMFHLIKEINWGFFKQIDSSLYPKLWKELVLQNDIFKTAGDLKREMTVTNIFVGLLDIHGYTKFCQKGRNNLSLLQMLDDCIHNDIRNIAGKYDVITQRARGDEILMIGTTATDMLFSVLSIIDYFSKKQIIDSEQLAQYRTGEKIILPDMYISAGIAGGKSYTPVIITKNGDISGDVVNTAARLQARSNKLSPDSTRILITKHIYLKLLKDKSFLKSAVFSKGTVSFYNTGIICFKGKDISVYEVLFRNEDKYKKKLQQKVEALYNSSKKGLWKQQIFIDLINLISEGCSSMPPFKTQVSIERDKIVTIKNESLIKLCNKALLFYVSKEDYSAAINTLSEILKYLEMVTSYDKLILEYSKEIVKNYNSILDIFNLEIDKEIDTKIDTVLSIKEREKYYILKRNNQIYNEFRDKTRLSNILNSKKKTWYRIIDNQKTDMSINIYSFKE